MPAMPRPNKKATKIAFKILGKPAALNPERPPQMEKVERRLEFEETSLVR